MDLRVFDGVLLVSVGALMAAATFWRVFTKFPSLPALVFLFFFYRVSVSLLFFFFFGCNFRGCFFFVGFGGGSSAASTSPLSEVRRKKRSTW